MIFSPPGAHFFTSGAGEGVTEANALDAARLAAGIGHVALVAFSGVLPPRSRLIERHALPVGTLVPMAGAAIGSTRPGLVISAAVAAAYPQEEDQPPLIMTSASPGHKEDIEAMVRRMAEEALAGRGQKLRAIRSLAVQHRVERTGAALAAIVLASDQAAPA